MSTVSIIIPAYNQGQYLGEAIQSVLDQTYQDFEIIVVDDGSVDHTRQVVGTYHDPRLAYYYQENGGLSAARNTGIKYSNSPYLLFLDADDRLYPIALELHLKNIGSKPGIGMSVGGWEYVHDQDPRFSQRVSPPASFPPESFLYGNPFPVHSVLVNREWIDRCGLFDETLKACEDWDLWLRFSMAGCKIASFNEIVCIYRVHSSQMTKQPVRMRTAMLTLLDKVFRNTALPPEWKDLQDKAEAAALVKAAAREYHAGLTADAKRDLTRAVRQDPGLLAENGNILASLLAGWAEGPTIEDPLKYLKEVYQGLPGDLLLLKRRYHKDLARLSMQLAFDSYQRGQLSKSRYYILQAAINRPAWLANRGVLSMLMRSLLRWPLEGEFSRG